MKDDGGRSGRRLAQLLAELPGFAVEQPETNIVLVDVPVPAAQLVEAARDQGVLCNAFGPRRVRLVLHLDVPAAAVPEAVARLRKAARA